MITKNMIDERINVLNSDIENTRKKISELEQQKTESVALLNALMGAKQQCDSFLKQIDDVEPEMVSDSSDVDSK